MNQASTVCAILTDISRADRQGRKMLPALSLINGEGSSCPPLSGKPLQKSDNRPLCVPGVPHIPAFTLCLAICLPSETVDLCFISGTSAEFEAQNLGTQLSMDLNWSCGVGSHYTGPGAFVPEGHLHRHLGALNLE